MRHTARHRYQQYRDPSAAAVSWRRQQRRRQIEARADLAAGLVLGALALAAGALVIVHGVQWLP